MVAKKYLQVKKSKLPGAGKGLFTKQFIAKGSLITEYKGKISTWKEIQGNDTFNGYVFYINKNHVIDAMKTLSAIGRYANDAKGAGRVRGLKNNSDYDIVNKKVYIRATADINAGDEILVNYGKEYWEAISHNNALELKRKKAKVAKRA